MKLKLAKTIPKEEFKLVILSVKKLKTVWVSTFKASILPHSRRKKFPYPYEC